MSIHVALLTGGDDPTYAIPLATALLDQGITVDFIGNDDMQQSPLVHKAGLNYLNLRGDQNPSAPTIEKVLRVLRCYSKLFTYGARSETKIFHILWLNKFIYFDRTLLNVYFKLMGKKLIFTAHNINMGERDGNDSFLNRFTLRFMYKIVDHIFVHTTKMKTQLVEEFGIDGAKVTVIPFGINYISPKSNLSSVEAREKLGLERSDKIILFFGQIAQYKGLDYLICALSLLKERSEEFKLVIAGKVKCGQEEYWMEVQTLIKSLNLEYNVVSRIEFIPQEDIEIYFKAADVLVLPYRTIFQTGVLFLAYDFGLPVVTTDVGSLKEDVLDGYTGFICEAENPEDLAKTILKYYKSSLFERLDTTRQCIARFAVEKYSWQTVAEKTRVVYEGAM